MFGENCAQCGARMSKNDILSGVKSLDVGPRDDAAAAPDTRCGRCHHRYRPTVEVVFSLGREGTEHHKDRVAFFADKVYLVAAVKERDRQGGRKSFAAVTLAEERCRRPFVTFSSSWLFICIGSMDGTSRPDLFWNLVYHYGSLKDGVCSIFPKRNWNAAFSLPKSP